MDGARNYKSNNGVLVGAPVALAGPRGTQAWVILNDDPANTYDFALNGQTTKVKPGEAIGVPVQGDAATLNGTGAYRFMAFDDAGMFDAFMRDAATPTGALVDDSVTAVKIAAGAVGTSEVEDNSLTASDLAPNSVGASEVAAAVAGDGLAGGGGSALSVGVDGTTIEINADALRVKDAGISTAKVAANAITDAKRAVRALVALADAPAAPTKEQLADDGILIMTPGAARVVTLPSTADLLTKLGAATGSYFDFILQSLAAFALTVTAADGDTTTTGSMEVGSGFGGQSATFRVLRTGATTVKIVRAS